MKKILSIIAAVLAVVAYLSGTLWLMVDANFRGARFLAVAAFAVLFVVEICALRVYFPLPDDEPE